MTHWSNKQWHLIVQDDEADVVLKEHSDPYCTPPTDERDLKLSPFYLTIFLTTNVPKPGDCFAPLA
eukprot:167743-Ditylum_brightwellii.AAC.1